MKVDAKGKMQDGMMAKLAMGDGWEGNGDGEGKKRAQRNGQKDAQASGGLRVVVVSE